ncbi:hypothetical protein LTR62_000937 [Meristemomyces frigidus]|uniref:Peptidase S9 prolyl oligopeptidase catalytic domain-containing protein n=1 Tax=Meristemomyces frigidus TaxID=1508187 RepID=A0AAN7YC22_9PEZI|nr:hypothetical protein LTR62_000937 [Meristemomyces frigidus]
MTRTCRADRCTEAVWGVDPLELWGGFRAFQYDEDAIFKTSLGFNATTGWSKTKISFPYPPPTQQATAALTVDFPDVDWDALQDVYGWPALQWQAWARGTLHVRGQGSITLALHTEHALEVWVDDEHYFGGDMYGYGRAAATLHLDSGSHTIDIRLVRDVRAQGAVDQPTLDVKLRVQALGPMLNLVKPDNNDVHQGVLMPDIVGGNYGSLASSYGSVTLRNDALQDVTIVDLQATYNQCETELVSKEPITFVPGQTRPVAFRIACAPPIVGRGALTMTVRYIKPTSRIPQAVFMSTWPSVRELHEPHKITYLHPGGMVSYAVLQPPSPSAPCELENNAKAPVMLVLHGAGLEADDERVRTSLDELSDICAWILFPTGVTPWSGDDWHTWGLADVEAAIAAIPTWIEENDWTGVGVDVNRWLVTGHSNGGQGAWHILTHRPDNVIAAAPLSGYSSIQNYVPYTMWRPAEPAKVALLQGALNSYRHELLLESAKDIPILQQHGGDDDNVSPFHSRQLNWLLENAAGVTSTYNEIPGKPHWWDGVFTTEPLKHFYRQQLDAEALAVQADFLISRQDFAAISAGNGDMGPKNGVQILQIRAPGRLGKVHITHDPIAKTCAFETTNVLSFQLPKQFEGCAAYFIDGQNLHLSIAQDDVSSPFTIMTYSDNVWQQISDHPENMPPRQGRQQGTVNAILRTRDAFQIVSASPAAKAIALQVSRNLCQYFGADTVITEHHLEAISSQTGNIITVALGNQLPSDTAAPDLHFPFSIQNNKLQIRDIDGTQQIYPFTKDLGAIWLRPLPNERLELVIWGAGEKGLETAARLAPLMTGSGQPDFVVVNHKMLFQGLEGVLALGYFDSWWNISRNAFFT